MSSIVRQVQILGWCAVLSMIAVAQTPGAQPPKLDSTETFPAEFAISPNVRDLPIEPSATMWTEIHEPGPSPLRSRVTPGLAETADPLAKPMMERGEQPMVSATSGASFSGMVSPGYVPSDSNIAVGPNDIVEAVNVEFAVYSKTGALLAGPTSIQNLFTSLTSLCGNTFGDPVVLYDRAADRWVISDIGTNGATTIGAECIAVSKTNDPTGAYYTYGYSFGGNLNDYPKLSTWATASNSAYLGTFNIFNLNSSDFEGADLCGFDRTKMLAGNSSAAMLCKMTPSSEGSYLPGDMDGPTAPVDGTPGLFITWQNNNPGELYLRKLTLNFSAGTSSLSSATVISVANATMACTNGGQCVPQEGTTQTLDSLGDRLMYRFAIRHFSDHDRAVVSHVVASAGSVAVRWYELYDPAGTVTLNQQGTYAPDANYRWMASLAEDQVANIGMGYSVSSSSMYPSIRFTGRVPSDTLGTMETENTILTGTASQVDSGNTAAAARWGDYTAMQVDPNDDCTFWYVDQYQAVTGAFDWYTNISSFSFPSCSNAANFTLSASPNAISMGQGATSNPATISVNAINGFSGNVTLSASSLPAGVTAAFSPNPATSSSAVTFTAAATATPGTYTATITGTSGALQQSTSVGLTVTATAAGDTITLSASTLTWNKVADGQIGTIKTVTAKNTGTVTATISSIATSANFSLETVTTSNACGTTLGAGKSCIVKVAFTPTQGGALTGALTFRDNAGNSPQTVSLSGTGVALALSPTSLSFGPVAYGSASSTQTVTITNNSSSSVTFNGFTMLGSKKSFLITNNTCGTSLAQNSSCTVTLEFQPTGKASFTATLQVASNGGGSPQTVTMSGTGD